MVEQGLGWFCGCRDDMATDTDVQLSWYLSWLCGALERYNKCEFCQSV